MKSAAVSYRGDADTHRKTGANQDPYDCLLHQNGSECVDILHGGRPWSWLLTARRICASQRLSGSFL